MRLFTAINLPDEMIWKLERLLAMLRSEVLIKWNPIDNLHITTKFIGEWPAERVPELENRLLELLPQDPIEIELRGIEWFPNERSPKILWMVVHASSALSDLARKTEQCLAPLGISLEDRPFSPHLTLARIKNPVPLDPLRRKLEQVQPASLGTFQATSFALFRSDPGSHASIYRKVRSFPFQQSMSA